MSEQVQGIIFIVVTLILMGIGLCAAMGGFHKNPHEFNQRADDRTLIFLFVYIPAAVIFWLWFIGWVFE